MPYTPDTFPGSAVIRVRRAETYRLYREGKTSAQIVKILNDGGNHTSVQTVSRDIKIVLKELAKANELDVALLRAEAKDKLVYIASEAMQSWESSKKYSVKKTKKSQIVLKGGALAPLEEEQIEQAHGDPRFLEIAKDCVEAISDIYGLYPKEEKSTGISQAISVDKSGEIVIKTSWLTGATGGLKTDAGSDSIDVESEEVKEEEVKQIE